MRWKRDRSTQATRPSADRRRHTAAARHTAALVSALACACGPALGDQPQPPGATPPPRPIAPATVAERNPVGDFFAGVLSIPALPLRFVTAVENGATGIRETAAAGNRIADVAETLPQKVRFEVEQMDQTFERFENISSSVERASVGFADAGHAWTGTINAFDKTMQHLRDQSQADTQSASGPAFDVRYVADSTRGLADAAHEARLLMEQIDHIMASAALTQRLDQVSSGARQTLEQTTHSARSLIDHATWAATRLLLVILAVGLTWRMATGYLSRWARTASHAASEGNRQAVDGASPPRQVDGSAPGAEMASESAADKTFDPNAPDERAGYRYRDLVKISPFRLIRPDEVEPLRAKKVG